MASAATGFIEDSDDSLVNQNHIAPCPKVVGERRKHPSRRITCSSKGDVTKSHHPLTYSLGKGAAW
ncbi:hypothetical protein [Paenisporosarcina sp. OV554]|uniref:hypothetical protein n=1 Tax=Paenisporosarcina sp. OV554 TaxID=2135694 RepID=UPI001304EF32|nr:hypothetical protein [Paenisporosarcina sp. OV554]